MGYGCRGCGEDDAKCRRDRCKECCYCGRPLIEQRCTTKPVDEAETRNCTMCEDHDNLVECSCGSIMCVRCLDTYGGYCPGCGGPR